LHKGMFAQQNDEARFTRVSVLQKAVASSKALAIPSRKMLIGYGRVSTNEQETALHIKFPLNSRRPSRVLRFYLWF